jgi:hypothetical protein
MQYMRVVHGLDVVDYDGYGKCTVVHVLPCLYRMYVLITTL